MPLKCCISAFVNTRKLTAANRISARLPPHPLSHTYALAFGNVNVNDDIYGVGTHKMYRGEGLRWLSSVCSAAGDP